MMAINCPLEYESVNSRLRTAAMSDVVDWLMVRTPEGLSALSDATRADPKALTASMTGLQSNNLFSAVRSLGVPFLLDYGLNDPVIFPPSQNKADTLPLHVHQVALEGAGHFPMIENPVQFNRLLTDFLALDSGMSPRELQLKEEWRRRVR
jgi:pimeloyl-ACP methyl ester carboxylesterase